MANAELPRGVKPDVLPYLSGWHSPLLAYSKEHLHHLCVIFDRLREHNWKLKPSKCNFFKEEITYPHWVSKGGVQPSNSNLKAIAKCASPQTCTEVCAFLGLVGHYQRFIKGFACIVKPLNELLTGEGARRKSKHVALSEDALKAFKALKQACMTAPYWSLLTTPNPFC